MKEELTIQGLKEAAGDFADAGSSHDDPSLYGVTDGKAVGTYLEHKFLRYLRDRFDFEESSSAKGIDLPVLGVDMKTTSIRQPQSSCPFRSPEQKIYGLGYCLLVFVYDKTDDDRAWTGRLDIKHVVLVDRERTADYQMTRGIRDILDNAGNEDDLVAFMRDKLLPVDDIQASRIAQELLRRRPEQGYLAISNALQWRLQYRRVIELAGSVEGVHRVR